MLRVVFHTRELDGTDQYHLFTTGGLAAPASYERYLSTRGGLRRVTPPAAADA